MRTADLGGIRVQRKPALPDATVRRRNGTRDLESRVVANVFSGSRHPDAAPRRLLERPGIEPQSSSGTGHVTQVRPTTLAVPEFLFVLR
ncbi:hypothetical protein MTO96_013601 [Rhipicephalus appendiculatus]